MAAFTRAMVCMRLWWRVPPRVVIVILAIRSYLHVWWNRRSTILGLLRRLVGVSALGHPVSQDYISDFKAHLLVVEDCCNSPGTVHLGQIAMRDNPAVGEEDSTAHPAAEGIGYCSTGHSWCWRAM